MRVFTFLLLAVFSGICLSVSGQTVYTQLPVTIKSKSVGFKKDEGIYKTQADTVYLAKIDTVVQDSTFLFRCQDPNVMYNPLSGAGQGFATGTQSYTSVTVGGQPHRAIFNEFAVRFSLDNSNFTDVHTHIFPNVVASDSLTVSEIVLPYDPSNPNIRFYYALEMGTGADQFHAYLYDTVNQKAKIGATIIDLWSPGKRLGSTTFDFNTLLNSNHVIYFDKPVRVPADFFVALEGRTPTSDDTVAYPTNNFSSNCGLAQDRTWGFLQDSVAFIDGYQIGDTTMLHQWQTLRLSYQNLIFDADLILFPVVTIWTCCDTTVGRKSVRAGGLALHGTCPNPADRTTTIRYNLDVPSAVEIKIMDNTGRIIQTINKGTLTAGQQEEVLDVEKLSSGVYFYNVRTANGTLTSKFTVFK